MNRRAFLSALTATASGLVLPWEPRRVYSFGSGRWHLHLPGRVITMGTPLGSPLAVGTVEEAIRRHMDRSMMTRALPALIEIKLGFATRDP
jgi:hypothetical protein